MEIWIIAQVFAGLMQSTAQSPFGPHRFGMLPSGVGQSTPLDTQGSELSRRLQRHHLLNFQQIVAVEFDFRRADHAVHLLSAADADDCPGDRGIPQRPGDRDSARRQRCNVRRWRAAFPQDANCG